MPMAAALDRVAAASRTRPAGDAAASEVRDDLLRPAAGPGTPWPRACARAGEADLLLAVGSSLSSSRPAGLVRVAAEAGARIVIINASPTPYDRVADALIREPIGTVLPALTGAVPAV